MFCKNNKKRAWETVFFGIVFVLWLVEQGSPPPPFYLQNHAVVEEREEGWKLSDGSMALGPFSFVALHF
jgi:hypothetical protein